MLVRVIGNIFLDDSDLYLLGFALAVLVLLFVPSAWIPLAIIKKDSLAVLLLFLLLARFRLPTDMQKTKGMFLIALSGLLFSFFLSPYGLFLYLLITSTWYHFNKR
jgi:hypothetical protein